MDYYTVVITDVLDEFSSTKPVPSAPPPSTTTTTAPTPFGNRPRNNTRVDAPPISIPGSGPRLESTTEEEALDENELSAEFARELAKGMENLMKEITTGLDPSQSTSGGKSKSAGEDSSSAGELTDEERMKAFKAAWEAMLVEGLNGTDDPSLPGLGELLGKEGVKPKGDVKDSGPSAPPSDFQSRIKQTMDKLKESESNLQVCGIPNLSACHNH